MQKFPSGGSCHDSQQVLNHFLINKACTYNFFISKINLSGHPKTTIGMSTIENVINYNASLRRD